MSAHVSAAEAARMYGLSDKTVRRWIKAGKLRADIRDGAYLVAPADVSALVGRVSAQTSVPTSAPGTDTPAEDVRPSEPAGADTALPQSADPLLTIIRELQAELLQTTAAAAMWQERARVLGDQLALAAPQSPPEAPRASEPPEPTTEPAAPWWRWIALLAPVLVTAIVVVAIVLLVVPR